jgi:hypothetical protein
MMSTIYSPAGEPISLESGLNRVYDRPYVGIPRTNLSRLAPFFR